MSILDIFKRRPSLKTIEVHLNRAQDLKDQHVSALHDAAVAADEHELHAKNVIAGLASQIGEKQAELDKANEHRAVIEAGLSLA